MGTELQDAADRLANRIPLEPGDREVLVNAARRVANPDLSALDDMPPLYEISPKSLPHLEALKLVGDDIVKVPNKRIIESTLEALGVTEDE